MMHEGASELEALRRRAYGRHADIHLDPQAVNRLRELEGDSRPPLDSDVPTDNEIVSTEVAIAEVAETVDDSRIVEVVAPTTRRKWPRELLTYLSRIRRSTALIALGALVAVVLGVIALILVQRVQTDPLQVGAEQVARLSIDASYEIPQFFGYVGSASSVEGFQEFYGLRTVAVYGSESWFYNGGTGDCMTIFDDAIMEPDSNSFNGLLLGGCAAGGFPATAQITVAAEGLPDELRSAFPDSAAFQFVLDVKNHEVVVFLTD